MGGALRRSRAHSRRVGADRAARTRRSVYHQFPFAHRRDDRGAMVERFSVLSHRHDPLGNARRICRRRRFGLAHRPRPLVERTRT